MRSKRTLKLKRSSSSNKTHMDKRTMGMKRVIMKRLMMLGCLVMATRWTYYSKTLPYLVNSSTRSKVTINWLPI